MPRKKGRGKVKKDNTLDAGYGHVFRFPYDDHSAIVDGKPSGWSHRNFTYKLDQKKGAIGTFRFTVFSVLQPVVLI